MTKGNLAISGGQGNEQESALRFLKVDESMVVAIPSVKEFYIKQTVSVYDSVNNKPVILPTVVEKGETTLYDKAVKALWEDYNKVKTDDVERKKVLNKINALKRQDTVYFGMKDINTGEDIILSMGINLEEGRKDKAGNNFHKAVKKLEKQLKNFPVEITKGSMGAWTIMPYMEDLTPEQKANFEAVKELDDKVYEGCFFRSNEDKQAEDLRKFGSQFGFDVTRLGIEAIAPATEGNEEKEEQYDF